MDWREKYEQAAARYRAGEGRAHDERQLVQLGNAAWAAGLCLLMLGDRPGSSVWLVRSAARYRESWDAGAPTDAWGRPIAAMKALPAAMRSAANRNGNDAGKRTFHKICRRVAERLCSNSSVSLW